MKTIFDYIRNDDLVERIDQILEVSKIETKIKKKNANINKALRDAGIIDD